MKFSLVFSVVVVFGCCVNSINAQKLSLNDCMRYAIENNQSVKKQTYTNNSYQQDKIEAVASLFPSIGANVYGSLNYGRSIDPATNTYTTTGNFGNSYSIGASMPVFSGFTYLNSIRISRTMELMGLSALEKIKDEVAINTMQSFFDVVYAISEENIIKEQLATSERTLSKSSKMLELGLKSEADVAQIQAQVASDELLLTQQHNKLNIAILGLKQRMNYPIDDTLQIEAEEDLFFRDGEKMLIGEVVDFALLHNPKIMESAYNVRRSELNYYYNIGKYFPSISVGAGYSTNYYENLKSDVSTTPFWSQFKDNRGHYFQASMSIPIFSGLNRRANVKRAKNDWEIAQEENSEITRALETEVAQTVMEREGYDKEYELATKKVEATGLAHDASLKKYDLGTLGAIELQTSANQLHQAKSQQLNAKLQYVIRTKLIDYYNGGQLVK